MKTPKTGRRRIRPEEDAKLTELYWQGRTDRELSEAVGRPQGSIITWRKRHGLPANAPLRYASKGPRTWDPEAAMVLYRQGLNDNQIARGVGTCSACIRQWRGRHDLPPNRTTERKEEPPARPEERMFMSDEEILRSYRLAADPKEQIKVLADLNACGRRKMREHLKRLGADVGEDKSTLRRICKIDSAEADRLYRQGLPDRELAQALGVTRNSAAQWREREGLLPNPDRKGRRQ